MKVVTLISASLVLTAAVRGVEPPVPDGQQIKGEMLKSMRRSEEALENYSCIARSESEELSADGAPKKKRSSEKEQFFVNGIQIEHTLKRDGKSLSAGDAAKEQQRVDKQVRKYSDRQQAEKARLHDEKEVDTFLRALRLSNGRREYRAGRATLVYDLSPDPAFHAKKLEERFAAALSGRIWIDEQSGTPAEVRLETVRDVKVGAGLLANLHKGFWLHLIQKRQADRVWLTQQVEGSGAVRAALFMQARFRFREELQGCHLFSVKTEQSVSAPGSGPRDNGTEKP